MKSEEKLLWMCDTLENTVIYLNEKYPKLHLFMMVDAEYDGEMWTGKIHPYFLTDLGMCEIDRMMLTRRYRTTTFKDLIDQMMATVKAQDDEFKNQIKETGDFDGD